MKFYSEKLKRLFDTEKELVVAEEKVEAAKLAKEAKEKELRETREARAKEVEEAMKAAIEAREKVSKLLAKFTEDYGSFHYTVHNTGMTSLFNWMLGW